MWVVDRGTDGVPFVLMKKTTRLNHDKPMVVVKLSRLTSFVYLCTGPGRTSKNLWS